MKDDSLIIFSVNPINSSAHRSHHQQKLSDSNVGHKLLQKMGKNIETDH